jgi:hypothetical protein
MTDTQILSIAIMVVTVLAGALFNNFRINDMRDAFRDSLRAELGSVRSEINVVRVELSADIKALRSEMETNHSEMLHRFGDLDGRLTRIEERFMR